MQYRERLKEILCRKSIRKGGSFVLASGKTSDYYADVKLTTLDPEGSLCAAMAVLELFKKLTPYPKAIGGLSMGADPIVPVVAALSHQQGGPPVAGFLVRKEPKKHGTRKYLEGYQGQAGDPVVIVDDVCTTGGSTLKAIEQAQPVSKLSVSWTGRRWQREHRKTLPLSPNLYCCRAFRGWGKPEEV